MEGKNRLEILKKLLNQGIQRTQSDLQERLEKQGFKVNQSTISRDLRKLGAIRTTNSNGQSVYRLPDVKTVDVKTTALGDLILDIKSNGSLIVIHTMPGSASLIARHLDQIRPGGILGTLAGDDTVFIAPASSRDSKATMKEIEACFKREL